MIHHHVSSFRNFEADLDDEFAAMIGGSGDDGEGYCSLVFDHVGQGVADLHFGDLVAIRSR